MPALSAATMNVASMNVASRSRINPVASGTRAGGADSLRLKKVRAHVSGGAEREVLFEKLNAMSKSTEQYQQMCAPRELPLVVLREI